MNRKIHVSCVAAGALLVSVLGAGAYQRENFDTGSTYENWTRSSNTIVVSVSSPAHSNQSLSIPIFQWVSNAVPANLTNQVWTDFWTIPTVYNSDGATEGPAIDSNATVQFFVNSSSNWTVYSGGDSYVGYKTNSASTLVSDHSTFHQVSVLSDYSNKTFSFFVDDVCLWKDLNFMTTNLSAAQWFQVQNLGGAAANVCYLDEYTLTNRLGGSILTNPVPGSTISVADALQYFNTTNNPIPSNTTVATANNSATWSFAGAVSGGTYKVLGSTSPSNGFGVVSGAVVNGTNLIAYLGSGTNRYFQRIVRESGVDASISATDTVVYAAYKQQYIMSNSTYIIGVPVRFSNPTDRTMAGAMGAQLAVGLGNEDEVTISENGIDYFYKWFASGPPRWDYSNAKTDTIGTQQWAQGVGMVVKRGSATSLAASIFAGLLETNSVQVALKTNTWAYLAWPYNDTVFASGVLGLTANSGDYMLIQTNGAVNLIAARYSGTTSKWYTRLNGSGPELALTLRAGDGIIYKNIGLTGLEFKPVGP